MRFRILVQHFLRSVLTAIVIANQSGDCRLAAVLCRGDHFKESLERLLPGIGFEDLRILPDYTYDDAPKPGQPNGPRISSKGADGIAGTADDISNLPDKPNKPAVRALPPGFERITSIPDLTSVIELRGNFVESMSFELAIERS